MRTGTRWLALSISLVVMSSFFLPAPARAQDPHKIVDQYLKAAGGSKALSQVRTVTLEGTATAEGADAADGTTGAFTFKTKLPNRYYLELVSGDKGLIEAYNGKSAWREVRPGPPQTLLGEEAAEMEAAAQISNTHLLNLKKNKIEVTYVGAAQVRGRDVAQVEVVTASGVHRQEYFDSQTHLLVKESSTAGGVSREIVYDDFRPEAGIQLPHRIELHTESESRTIVLNRVTVNEPVAERVFDFPRKSQAPLPDLKVLFKELEQNQKAIDKMKENYAGTRAEDQTEYEGNGHVKKHETSEYTFFYLQGEEISTQVKKDGKPLNEEEQKKENERVKKRIEEVQAHAAKKEAKEAKEEAKKAKDKEEGKEDKDDEDVGIDAFLRASQFVNPRRERFRGQDVLVFDFEGNPDYKPRNLAERMVQKLAGVVWVDENARDVARLEAYFTSDAKIAGGLLINLQRGTGFIFEQAYLNNEVWLPVYEEAHVGVRFLLVKGVRVSQTTRYSDYKRFHVESLSQVAAPKPQ
jgi:hypothetical protein